MKEISSFNLIYMLLPIGFVGYFYYRWVGNAKEIMVATLRMVVQLFLIGYLLIYIFNNQNSFIGLSIILFMIIVALFVALRNMQNRTKSYFFKIFLAILIGGSLNLLLVLFVVIDLEPLYQLCFIIPLAGMIYANVMSAVSLASEQFKKESKIRSYIKAKATALKSSLIPQINAFLAVGLVSLPGMMTGQILSGVDPVIAVRYQIVVMAMVLGSAGGSVILYLLLNKGKDA